jgi:hypothetical protein
MGRLPSDIKPPKNNCFNAPKVLWRPSLALVIAVVLSVVWLPACVPSIFSKKEASIPESKNGQKAELIKPLIAATAAEDTTDKTSAPERVPGRSENSGGTSATARSGSDDPRGSSDLTRTSADPAVQDTQAPDEESKGRKPGTTVKSDKDNARIASPEKTSLAGKEKTSDSDSEALEAEDAAFKHHDHAKYVTDIRNKAIDQLNKEKDTDLVRLCRNTTTDQWSLTMYRKVDRTYSFTDYAWDEINLKWEKVFSSGKKPVSGWKQHLDFTAAGKECRILKGDPEKW